jgi:hypothetical protein
VGIAHHLGYIEESGISLLILNETSTMIKIAVGLRLILMVGIAHPTSRFVHRWLSGVEANDKLSLFPNLLSPQ